MRRSKQLRAPLQAALARTALGVVLLAAAPQLTGCRVSDDDVHHWARKASGPKRLVAVLTHDKYPLELRVEAAMTLVTMKPRGGRAVGLLGGDESQGLLSALAELPTDKRQRIVSGMVPPLEAGIKTPPAADGTDASFAYKEAAYALLIHEPEPLVPEGAERQRLLEALRVWTQTAFEKRFDDTAQLYGMEQVLRLLKNDGVRGLTPLLTPESKKLDAIAKLVHELGDEATQLDASARLAQVASFVDSPEWQAKRAPVLKAGNEKAKLKVTDQQFAIQLATYQEEELLRVFSAMKSVGKKPVVDFLLAYARNDKNPEKRRAAALAALDGNLDRQNPDHAKAVLDLLADGATPDSIRDVAARRVGELPRAQVAERLYSLFDDKRWQVRWSVASLLLQMSDAKQIDEFMARLGKVREMAMSEPLAYGPLLHDLKGAQPEELADRFAKTTEPTPVRLSALGYYYRYGDKTDLPKISPYQEDTQKVPPCKSETGCEWSCTIAENKTQVEKQVATVGDFVRYCIAPALSAREPSPAP
ncbi:MAG TPA: hypothetical protein VLC09_05835 [Polyangiaceae bacterium]|nr:hypothetical protein [Polyangiaceae bacterium]